MTPTPSNLPQTNTFDLAEGHYARLVNCLQTKASQGLDHEDLENMLKK